MISGGASGFLAIFHPTANLGITLVTSRNALFHYFHQQWVAHQIFAPLYSFNWFDASLLTPYFVLMVVLAFYGLHRYQLVWLYYRHRKNATHEPPTHFAELPFITIQLPLFNEQYVVDRLIDAVCNLDYPRDRLEIQVLDDSTDETRRVAAAIVERYRDGFNGEPQPIVYIHRTNRHGYKAGALDHGLKTAKGELVAIFDADFIPPRDWLMRVVHHLADPGIGMVQTRWTHLNRDYSFLTQVSAILLDGHFILEHGGRSRARVFFNFNGTAGMWRRRAIEEAGGWQHDTLTEDTDLSYRAQLVGWRFKYLQDVECPAELPIEMTAFKTQQARWAKGLIQTAKKILPRVFRADLPFHIKARGVLSSHGKYQLSADGAAVDCDDAGDDHPLLSGMVSDAADRSAAVSGIDVFGVFVLPGFPKRIVSRQVVSRVALFAVCDGARRNWSDIDEFESRNGSAVRDKEQL